MIKKQPHRREDKTANSDRQPHHRIKEAAEVDASRRPHPMSKQSSGGRRDDEIRRWFKRVRLKLALEEVPPRTQIHIPEILRD
jgi:hypothetical protein